MHDCCKRKPRLTDAVFNFIFEREIYFWKQIFYVRETRSKFQTIVKVDSKINSDIGIKILNTIKIIWERVFIRMKTKKTFIVLSEHTFLIVNDDFAIDYDYISENI